MKNIFEKTWIWVANESELPSPGSFKSTYVGRNPVIVTRDRKGTFNTLVNRCRHRGASLCEQRTGKSNGFTCPYHAWSYGLDGKLRGTPYPVGYEGVIKKAEMSLQKLRTESYRGIIFATFNADAERSRSSSATSGGG
ncbi:Rieske (2Fe-2S) protein [Arthrobacter sp. efr-133-TYG-120]|uniref:aromatic ring-hydroxylating oxygenase subunit alpha n=1 Tax=Arthrobacter sp. efr-133-TYG-120 TaxID=3040280 RepID=UPI00254B61B5|nr:Rieske (2Fe-2S) protein [Arthrobacter sp. efr-133-TYG-120]